MVQTISYIHRIFYGKYVQISSLVIIIYIAVNISKKRGKTFIVCDF